MGLTIGITTLFIISGITPMVVGYNIQDDGLKCMLDNLRFVCITPRGFDEVRYEYYKAYERSILELKNCEFKILMLLSSYSIVINFYSLSVSWQAGQLSSLQAK